MDLDLKEFSLTLAVGLAVAGTVYVGFLVIWPRSGAQLARLIFRKDDQVRILPSVFATVIILAVGIVAEDLSKNALATRSPTAFAAQMRAILPVEGYERAQVLTESPKTIAHGISQEKCAHEILDDNPEKTVRIKLSPQGEGFLLLLQRLYEARVATSRELEVLRSLTATLDSWKREGRRSETNLTDPTMATDCLSYQRSLQEAYYLAKNTAYREKNYFEELQSINLRYVFGRSVAFVMLAGIYFVCFMFLGKNTLAMWRDVGGWKTLMCFALAIILIAALADVVVFPKSIDIACKRISSCLESLHFARAWMLPVATLFVCLYRTRRIWRRLGTNVLSSMTSTLPGEPLFQSAREREARRAALAVVVLAALLLPAKLSFESDDNNYLLRIFGYYDELRGSALQCGPPPPANQSTKALCVAAKSAGETKPGSD